MWRPITILAFFALSAIAGPALLQTRTEDMLKSDFTIYMDEPIVKKGGVVMIQPEAVNLDPAAKEALTTGTHEITISSQISIIRILYPSDGTYTYRFRSADPKKYSGHGGKTGRIIVGSAKDINPNDSSQIEEIPTYMVHHFEAVEGDWTIEDSQEAGSNLPKGFLELRYKCQKQDHALVCDAVGGDIRR